jgi:hypothetical protein
MDSHPDTRVISCDRMDNGVVVSFGDGKTALYSADFLYSTLPQARTMPSDSEDDRLTHFAKGGT